MTRALATVTHLGPVPVAQIQGTLALDLRGTATLPSTPEYDGATRSRLETLNETEVKRWSAVFAQAVVESIGGDRPVSQLVRWMTPRVYADLERRVQLVRLARPSTRARVVRPQVRSVHVCQPDAGCAEVSVHVRHGERSRALAARLEHRDGRWVCTALELG